MSTKKGRDGCPSLVQLYGQFARVSIERDRWRHMCEKNAAQSKARREETIKLVGSIGRELHGDDMHYNPGHKPGELRHQVEEDIRAFKKPRWRKPGEGIPVGLYVSVEHHPFAGIGSGPEYTVVTHHFPAGGAPQPIWLFGPILANPNAIALVSGRSAGAEISERQAPVRDLGQTD